jgi:hypothetical protein
MYKSTCTKIQKKDFNSEPVYVDFLFEVTYFKEKKIFLFNDKWCMYYLCYTKQARKSETYWKWVFSQVEIGVLFQNIF